MFKIIGEEDFENLNIIKTYTLLTILKNLGLEKNLEVCLKGCYYDLSYI